MNLLPIKKGIVLAGGTGSRLWPLTKIHSKQLLPVFDKPLIYYPIVTLMSFGIRDLFVITTERDLNGFKELLCDGSQWGVNIRYGTQKTPDGIPKALQIAQSFLANEPCALILGDNVFHANWDNVYSQAVVDCKNSAHIVCSRVNNPASFGVLEANQKGEVINILEKPANPPSNWAVTGLYFYPPDACEKSLNLTPSKRGETEITDLNVSYIKDDRLQHHCLDPSNSWFDTGTPKSLLAAANYVSKTQSAKRILIGSPEITSFTNDWISRTQLQNLVSKIPSTSYATALQAFL